MRSQWRAWSEFTQVFDEKFIHRDLRADELDLFRSANQGNKIPGATAFDIDYLKIDSPETIAEYDWIDQSIVAVYPPTRGMAVFTGRALSALTQGTSR